jgi:hypothetical protein
VAERTGTDVERDLGPMLLAGSIGSAIRVAMFRWLNYDRESTMGENVRAAIAELSAGLPSLAANGSHKSDRNHDD